MPEETPDILSMLMPQDADQAAAMLAAIQKRQGEAQAQQAQLRQRLGGQTGQAGNLRNLALLTSLGANPLLQGINRTAGEQAQQLESNASRTEGLLGRAQAGMVDPIRLATLQQAAERLRLAEEAAKTKAANDAKRLGLRETEAQHKAAAAAAKATAKAASDAAKDAQNKIKLEGATRKEFQALPAYKNYQIVATALDQMTGAFKAGTGAGDIAGITTFMKSIDPATGVKDQEFNNAQNSGGVFDKAQAAIQQVQSGVKLTPEQRKEFIAIARSNAAALKKTHDAALARYQGLATSYGLAPERVAAPASTINLEEPPPLPPAPSPSGKVGPGDPRNIKETRTLKDGRTLVIFADGHGEIRSENAGK
jgi:hypothetical protein